MNFTQNLLVFKITSEFNRFDDNVDKFTTGCPGNDCEYNPKTEKL